MENRQILIALLLLLLCLPFAACTEEPAPGLAIVIDAETGQPIEGAIALAQWFSAGGGALFEGPQINLAKAQETYSDKDGRIYFSDLWNTIKKPSRLTVYKPGYVLWDSKEICPFGKRTDFDEKHRTVKLLKFDAEAARWIKEYPERFTYRVGPHSKHISFYYNCDLHGDRIVDAFRQYELPLEQKEEADFDRKAKVK
jgi:hypothetical protein